MNSDSKPNRCVVLLNKAPFILFIESTNCLLSVEYLLTALEVFNLSFADTLTTIHVKPDQDLRKIISATNTLDDPLAYNIIEALATALTGPHHRMGYLISNKWQEDVSWQNVDIKPAPLESFTITINKFTHKLSIEDDVNTVIEEDDYEGVIHLDRADPTVPLPLRLLKECVIDIHNIVAEGAIGRTFTSIAGSKYISVLQIGYDTFYYVNMKKLEKELRAVLEAAGITIEE